MNDIIEHIHLSIDFSDKIDTKLIKSCNKVIDNENITHNLITFIKFINEYIYNKNFILADIETDLLEIQYYFTKLNDKQEYYELFINCLEFIEPIKLNLIISNNLRPTSVDFMKWFLLKTDELKRILKFDEFVELDSKFILAKINNLNFDSLKELNNLISF